MPVIDKTTFKNGQAWLAIRGDNGEYIGTWHIVNPEFVQQLKILDYKKIILEQGGKR